MKYKLPRKRKKQFLKVNDRADYLVDQILSEVLDDRRFIKRSVVVRGKLRILECW